MPEPLTDAAYPPTLTAEESEHLVSSIKDWSIAHGLAVRPPPSFVSSDADPQGVLAATAPVTLYPSPFPRVCFEQAKSVQTAYNQLYASISRDEEFLKGVVEEILEVDEFIAELWQVHLKVKSEGYTQPLSLGLFRSDYMVHQDSDSPDSIPVVKQVEFNTIAASFGGLSAQTSALHRYLSIDGYPFSKARPDAKDLPDNRSTQCLALGMRKAFEAYQKSPENYDTCILFVVQSPERNIFDQRHLEYELQTTSPSIPVFRLPFADILKHTTVADTKQRQLLYHPPHRPSHVYEVAVVYYRGGYGPEDYPSPSAWTARLQIERSYAIKCPSILTQLAGAKKVQQILATPRSPSSPPILEHFLPNSASISELDKTFTNIFPLDTSPSGLRARELALGAETCKQYVLKPQREGGGNNTYRSAIPPFLKSIPESHWKSYILMEIITPPPVHNMILRNGVVEKGGVICELGIYGTVLWNQETGEMLNNGGYEDGTGYLLRTKGDKSEEGGVAAGFGAMDSCLLV